ncbi:MAG TPA: NAD(P)-binding domain-containing protein, partial [Candidatus Deferrimicrobium sp.]|nr:NAD(P)-binding domain-containing protein [Candidatus Deferrimicrobium sp.]
MNNEIKNITVIGLGYVGLVTALCLASKGYNVMGVDRIAEIVENITQGQIHFYEPKLDDLLKESFETKRFSASDSYQEAVRKAELIFITVG